MTARTGLSLVFSCVVIHGLAVAQPADAQGGAKLDILPPTFGAVSQTPADSATPESPLPDGLSFKSLQDLMTGVIAPDKAAMRGAKEIAIFRQAAPAVVLIKTEASFGSGVVLPNGLIITNRHVVEGLGAVQILLKPNDLAQGRQAADIRVGRVRHVDPTRDLAVIQADSLPSDQKSLKLAEGGHPEVGADVYAIGHPLGYAWTFTQGIVSAVRRINEQGQSFTAVQTQTPMNPGNSGGPLINDKLEVVGISTWARDISKVEEKQVAGATMALARPAQGLNFAVSAADVRAFLREIQDGKITNLTLQMPRTQACAVKVIATGRSKENDAAMQAFSLRCDDKADAWLLVPDDQAKPKQFLLDPDRTGRVSIVVLADTKTGKWQKSYWDFFRDQTYAVVGHHDDGNIKPTRFEFAGS